MTFTNLKICTADEIEMYLLQWKKEVESECVWKINTVEFANISFFIES